MEMESVPARRRPIRTWRRLIQTWRWPIRISQSGLKKFGSYLGLTTERVTQSWELADSILSDGDKTDYDNQVHLYEKKGYTEEEARRLVSEEWGISDMNPDGSRTAQVVYREGDSGEVRYYLRLGTESLAIYFEL